jgi:hypothetical protein
MASQAREGCLLTLYDFYVNIGLVVNKYKNMQNIFKKLFGHKVGFLPVDPLADGLAEEIAKERREPQAIRLDANEVEDIRRFWSSVNDSIDE